MIYKAILKLRHEAYDKGRRKQYESAIPTVCIGNITVGGTGKTPHIEYLIDVLKKSEEWQDKRLAVLSRGYKRKSKGYQEVPEGGSAGFYGDEPVQIKNKFPDVKVVVDKNRVEACKILEQSSDIILLDDAFQYRKLKARVNIVLVDYYRPIDQSNLIPFGNLRDLPERVLSADIVIVTKCPGYLEDEEKEEWRRRLGIKFTQHLFFTTVNYIQPKMVFPECDPRYIYSKKLILVSGIANDKPLRYYLSDYYKILKRYSFPDHHKFKKSDISAIRSMLKKYPTAAVATTEKDAQRLRDTKKMPPLIKERLFQVPIAVGFLSEEEREEFENTLLCAIK